MLKEVGLWIDHRQAVIVITLNREESIKRITSDMEKHVRYSGASEASGEGASHSDTSEGGKERRFDDQLNRYYDEVISYLDDATTILIVGPGEAKVELQKRLESHGLSDRVAAVKTADKMTDDQIATYVRQHFRESHRSSKRIPQQ
jgi:hypothetical protein